MQVSSNGVLSFNSPFTRYASLPFPLSTGDILIAPLWTDIDITVTGKVFYRYSNDTVLLSRVGTTISSAFATNFNPALLFIATWDRVAEAAGTRDKVKPEPQCN